MWPLSDVKWFIAHTVFLYMCIDYGVLHTARLMGNYKQTQLQVSMDITQRTVIGPEEVLQRPM